MVAAKFKEGDKVKYSSRCPKYKAFKGVDRIVYVESDHYNKCSWYQLEKHIYNDYRSYELEKA